MAESSMEDEATKGYKFYRSPNDDGNLQCSLGDFQGGTTKQKVLRRCLLALQIRKLPGLSRVGRGGTQPR